MSVVSAYIAFTFHSVWIYFALCDSRILTCCIWSVSQRERVVLLKWKKPS